MGHRTVKIAAALALVTGLASLTISGLIPRTLAAGYSGDVWFEADLPRIFATMTSVDADTRSTHHPVYAILARAAAGAVMALGVQEALSVRIVLALSAAAWPVCLFLLLRAIGCRPLDSTIFTLLGLSSASMIFFLGVPETFLIGSLTIMIGFIWAARDEQGTRSAVVEAFISAATLSISITNWMVGLLSAFLRRRRRSAAAISVAAFVIVVGLWGIQELVFSVNRFFLTPSYFSIEREHLLSPEAIGARRIVAGFVAHPMVMPAIQLVDRPSSGRWPLLLTQASHAGSTGAIGVAALVFWIVLLAAGVIALLQLIERPRLRLLLAGVIAGQLVLHLTFGNETFFYALHWIPLLIALAAHATLLRGIRTPVLVLASGLTLLAGVNNLTQLSWALRFLRHHGPMVQTRVTAETRAIRQADPWPGAVTVLKTPWDRDDYDQAAYEAGGTFWPSMDTFSIAIWVTDMTGRVVTTSHVQESGGARVRATETPTPRLESTTSDYSLTWQSPERRHWELELSPVARDGKQHYLMVRGVGWQFTHIRSLVRDKAGLLINSRWRIALPDTVTVALGVEDGDGIKPPNADVQNVTSEIGWAYARIGPIPAGTGAFKVRVFDERASGSVDTLLGPLDWRGRVPMPDAGERR